MLLSSWVHTASSWDLSVPSIWLKETLRSEARPLWSSPYFLCCPPFCPERCRRCGTAFLLKTALRQRKVLPSTSGRSQSVSRGVRTGWEQPWEAPFRSLPWKPHFVPQSPSPQGPTSGLKWVFVSDGFHTTKALVNKFALLLSFESSVFPSEKVSVGAGEQLLLFFPHCWFWWGKWMPVRGICII